jgi:predicted ribosomally synthesized peptide with nif11-like leader
MQMESIESENRPSTSLIAMNGSRAEQSMPEQQLKAFLEKVKTEKELQQKIKEAKCEGCIVEIANQAGFTISTDDLIDVELGLDSQSVTDLSNEILH